MPMPRIVFFFLTSFLADATTLLVITLLAVHAQRHLGATSLQLGILGTINSAGYAVFSYVSGRLSDRTGRRVWVVIGASAHLLGSLLLPYCTTMGAFMTVSMLQMSLLGCFWAPLMGWLSETTRPAQLSRTISRWNMTWCAGTIVGSFAGGYLYDHFAAATPFHVGAALMVPVLAIVAIGRPSAQPHRDAPPPITHPMAARFTWQAWLTLAGSMFVVNLLVYLFPKLLELNDLKVEAESIGIFHGVRLAAMFMMFWLMGSTTRWHFRTWLSHVSFALLCAVMIMTGFIRVERLFALPFLTLGVAMGIAYGLSVYYSMMMPAKGHMGGVHEALMSSGGTVGPIFGGALIQASGSPALTCWSGLIPLAIVWGFCFKLSWKMPPPTVPPDPR
jgi:MFS family permease